MKQLEEKARLAEEALAKSQVPAKNKQKEQKINWTANVSPLGARFLLLKDVYLIKKIDLVQGKVNLDLLPGKYQVTVSKRGYSPISQSITVSKESLTYNVELTEVRGKLTVKSNPSVTILSKDESDKERELGKTDSKGSLIVDYLKEGNYKLILSKKNYSTDSATVQIDESKSAILKLFLTGLPGKLEISSNKNADVYEKNSKIGTLNNTISNLSAGKHKLEIRKKGYRTEKISIEIPPNGFKMLTAPTLEKLTLPPFIKHIITLKAKGYANYIFGLTLPAPNTNYKPLTKKLGKIKAPSIGSSWKIPDLGMEFVYVKSGSFQMGSNNGNSDEKPVHTVNLTNDFWVGKYEVMQAEYKKIMGNNPSSFKGNNNPVEQVSWNEAVYFCKKLTERERKAGRLSSGYVYRLPTEAEWEYAAKGGAKSGGYKYSGSDSIGSVAWYNSNSGSKTHPVGQKKANELGIYDMSGNVWEWCSDWYGDYPSGSVTNPVSSGAGSYRVLRGGSWRYDARYCRSAYRLWDTPSGTNRGLGFRLLRAISTSLP
ncbi:MAG: SUMF1/EgtB/PvdO family nonheme iron enzyme [Verrucomicrobiota bacterium]|nr:SUMF1/EgtB/PvdO family nonheme iron enzyme [Verrucomicrobiota bacterium]